MNSKTLLCVLLGVMLVAAMLVDQSEAGVQRRRRRRPKPGLYGESLSPGEYRNILESLREQVQELDTAVEETRSLQEDLDDMAEGNMAEADMAEGDMAEADMAEY